MRNLLMKHYIEALFAWNVAPKKRGQLEYYLGYWFGKSIQGENK